MSLKQQAVSGVKWTSISAIVASGLQLLQVAVLARFLDKDDFGLMAMALFVIGISRIFIDMGISNALVHKQRVNKYQLSTLFWLNIILGIVIFGIVVGASRWVAVFYKTPELQNVIDWVAVTFLILPLGQQFDSLLKRDMRFKSLAIRDILSKLLGFIVAVILAYKGFGVYALVFANLAGASVAAGLLLFLGLRDYRPKFIISFRSLKNQGFYSFGLFQMGEKVINYFNANFDTILIGKLLGMEALGVYNIAKTLTLKPFQVINPIVTKVAFPTFAKVQDDIEKLKNAYLKVVNFLTTLNAPIYIVMIVLAKPLILLAFGDNWLSAIPILQLLAIETLFRSIGNPVGSLQLAKGRADLGFYWNLGMLALMPAVIWYGGQFGLIQVALALAIYRICITYTLAWLFFIQPLCRVGYLDYFWSFTKPLIFAVVSSIVPFVVFNFDIISHSIFVQILIGGLLYISGFVICNWLWNKQNIKDIVTLMNISPLNKLKNYL